jgi:hypothetical protein
LLTYPDSPGHFTAGCAELPKPSPSKSRYSVTLLAEHVPFLPLVQVVAGPQSQGIEVPFTHSQPSLDWPSQFSSTPAASQTSVLGAIAPEQSFHALVVLSLLAWQV